MVQIKQTLTVASIGSEVSNIRVVHGQPKLINRLRISAPAGTGFGEADVRVMVNGKDVSGLITPLSNHTRVAGSK